MTTQRSIQFDNVYMNIAKEVASLSYCNKRKVGAIIVRDTQIISQGYNGTPSGRDNNCEINRFTFKNGDPCNVYPPLEGKVITKSEVIHAEDNAILKCAKYGVSSNGGTLYVTCSPCIECSKAIIQSGIKRVVYDELHDSDGLELMRSVGIVCEKLSDLLASISPNVSKYKKRILKCIEEQSLSFNGTITSITTMIDLGFDDLDRVELIMKIEKELDINLNTIDGLEDSDNANTIYSKIKDYLRK